MDWDNPLFAFFKKAAVICMTKMTDKVWK